MSSGRKEKTKTVVIFNGFYLPHLGGVERYTAGLIEELKKDYKVILVTSNVPKQPQHETIDGIEIYRLNAYNFIQKNRLPFLKHDTNNRAIIKKLQSLDITNVICNTRYYDITVLGLKIARLQNITPIIIDHSSDYILKPWEKYMLFRIKKYAPKYYTVSQKTAEWLKTIGIKSEGVFYNSVASQKDFTKTTSEKTRLIYAGRVMKEKGLEYIVDSYNKLKKDHNISLEIIGDGPLLNSLKKANEGIIFPGHLDHQEVLKHFKKSDIFVFPTLYPEGFPTVILEAAMNKCVIVATDRGGTKELVTDDSIGIILKNPEELTTKLKELINNKKRLKSMQEKAFKRVNESFTWSKTVKVIKKELEKYEKQN